MHGGSYIKNGQRLLCCADYKAAERRAKSRTCEEQAKREGEYSGSEKT
jgi:hypothetical protein